jgi:hypothetical protein
MQSGLPALPALPHHTIRLVPQPPDHPTTQQRGPSSFLFIFLAIFMLYSTWGVYKAAKAGMVRAPTSPLPNPTPTTAE